jgi:hypothetical protein
MEDDVDGALAAVGFLRGGFFCAGRDLFVAIVGGGGYAFDFFGCSGRAGVGGPIFRWMAGYVGETEIGIVGRGYVEILLVFGLNDEIFRVNVLGIDWFGEAVGYGCDVTRGASVAAGEARAVNADSGFRTGLERSGLGAIATFNSAIVLHRGSYQIRRSYAVEISGDVFAKPRVGSGV